VHVAVTTPLKYMHIYSSAWYSHFQVHCLNTEKVVVPYYKHCIMYLCIFFYQVGKVLFIDPADPVAVQRDLPGS
jgi:exosome complex RNA-binding protein Rrp42 (RNase PH superfamily)